MLVRFLVEFGGVLDGRDVLSPIVQANGCHHPSLYLVSKLKTEPSEGVCSWLGGVQWKRGFISHESSAFNKTGRKTRSLVHLPLGMEAGSDLSMLSMAGHGRAGNRLSIV